MTEREIFLAALKQPSAGERAQFLDQACGLDSNLRGQIEALLAEYEQLGSYLEAPVGGEQRTLDQQPPQSTGTQIGPYKLLQQIGEGGMGVVYMAEQTEPVQRRVALKIIKPGMDTRQVIARFEAERQALSMMDHPNIAKVFDAGTTESGRPFFVMELVRGVPITKYCDEHRLTLKQRLDLFLHVCQAVQHAHQKGIIHRDLKPTNVLVAHYDDKPVPKVIDFGVAKAAQKLTERTMFTEFGQVVGTLEYMSPEQAQLNQLDIDTRSDIYSLGVILYELLTGCTPFDGKRLRTAAFDEMLRIIREEEPPRPSTRLSSAQTLPSIAASRSAEPARLGRALRGELDWIVMKALEKDRNRRYETANAFAQDLHRYLADETVQACPPSAGYRFRKFARRNKTVLITVTLIASALLAGIVGTTWQAIRAEAHAEQARTEAAKAQAIADLLQQMLASATPDRAKGGDEYTVRQMLNEFSASLGNQLADQPEVAAAIHSVMAKAYWRMDSEKAALHAEAGLKLHRQLYGPDHPKVADSLIDCAWALAFGADRLRRAVPLIQEAIPIYRRNGQDYGLMKAYRALVYAHVIQSQFGEAERVYHESLETYPRVRGLADAEMACILHEMSHAKWKQHDPGEAEVLARSAMELHARAHGTDGLETGYCWRVLGDALALQGKHPEAEACFRNALSIFHKHYGHSGLRGSSIKGAVNQLVHSLRHQKKLDEAVAVYREALDETVASYNKSLTLDPQSAPTHNNLAWLLATAPDDKVRNPARAAELAERAVELAPQQGSFWNTLGVAHYRTGDWNAAIDALEKSMELREGGDGFDWFFLAMAHWQQGDKAEARRWYDRAVAWRDTNAFADEELNLFRAEAAELLGVEKNEGLGSEIERKPEVN